MRLLLDTHVLLWAVAEPGKIAEPYREQIESADNEVFFYHTGILHRHFPSCKGNHSCMKFFMDLMERRNL